MRSQARFSLSENVSIPRPNNHSSSISTTAFLLSVRLPNSNLTTPSSDGLNVADLKKRIFGGGYLNVSAPRFQNQNISPEPIHKSGEFRQILSPNSLCNQACGSIWSLPQTTRFPHRPTEIGNHARHESGISLQHKKNRLPSVGKSV